MFCGPENRTTLTLLHSKAKIKRILKYKTLYIVLTLTLICYAIRYSLSSAVMNLENREQESADSSFSLFCDVWNRRFHEQPLSEALRGRVVFEPLVAAGFANQLRGIISAFFYAVLTYREFFIHWSEGNQKFRLEEYLAPNCLDWRLDRHVTYDPRFMVEEDLRYLKISGSKKGRGHPEIAYTFQSQNLREVHPERTIVISSNDLFYDNFYHNPHYCKRIRDMGFMHPDDIFHVIFEYLLKPTSVLQLKVNDTMKNFSTSLGIQMRLGGSQSETNFHDLAAKKMSVPSSSRYRFESCALQVVSQLQKKLERHSIFVTSDSTDFHKSFHSSKFVLTSNTGPIEHTGMGRLTHDGLLRVFADFIVLSRCDFIISSPGTFGSSAALAGGKKSFFRVSNYADSYNCSKVYCGLQSSYCSFSWTGFGVIRRNEKDRSYYDSSQPWDPYVVVDMGRGSKTQVSNKRKYLIPKVGRCAA